jgi:hypothetical protein
VVASSQVAEWVGIDWKAGSDRQLVEYPPRANTSHTKKKHLVRALPRAAKLIRYFLDEE